MSELDEKICKQMEGLVELLTTSGKPTLNPEIMKKFKKFCRISDSYVHHAFELLMKQLSVKHAEVRFSAYQMIDELFTRSHMFRELLLADFDTFLEFAAGTEKKKPLPAPKAVAENMKNNVHRSILLWVEKFGHAYRKLMLGFEFLKNFKKIDFDGIQATLDTERRQKEETERKLEECKKEKLDKVNTEYTDSELEIQLCLTEVENGLRLLMPRPDDFFIPLKDEGETSMLSNTSTLAVTSSLTDLDNKDMGIEIVTNKVQDISGNVISQETNDSESDEDGFEEVDTDKNGTFTQEHGLLDRKFALTVELGQSGRSLEETEDNKDLIQGVRDQYTLIKTKYLPAVKRWVQVMTENSGKEEKIKRLMEVKSKLEDAVRKCVELEIARSKRNRDSDSDSDEDDFEDVPEKEGYEEDVPEHIQMEAAMASTSKAKNSTGRKKRTPKKPKTETKVAKKKLGIKNVQQMARDILESQRLIEDDDIDSAVLKSKGVHAKSRLLMEDASLPFLQLSDNKEKYNIQQSATNQVSRHKVQDETQIQAKDCNGSPSTVCLKTEKSETQSNIACSDASNISKIEIQSKNQLKTDNAEKSQNDEDRKSSLLEKAPFINFGVDLEHWENPEKIKAPVKNRFDGASRFWVTDKDTDDQEAGGSEEVASLTRRSFTYVGQFEPVKWKCRAPMSGGKLCERMDRVKCPFHGKVIGRDKEGVPTNQSDAEQLSSGKMKTHLDETGGTSSEGESSSSRSKGKGKGKAKKRKYPNLTEINESKNNCRSRLEAKIFNRSTLRKVNKALDAETLKKLSNKFSHQFNYSLK